MIPILFKVVERPDIDWNVESLLYPPTGCTSCLMSFLATFACSVCSEQPPIALWRDYVPFRGKVFDHCISFAEDVLPSSTIVCSLTSFEFSSVPSELFYSPLSRKASAFLPLLCCRFLYSIFTDRLMILCLEFLEPECFGLFWFWNICRYVMKYFEYGIRIKTIHSSFICSLDM